MRRVPEIVLALLVLAAAVWVWFDLFVGESTPAEAVEETPKINPVFKSELDELYDDLTRYQDEYAAAEALIRQGEIKREEARRGGEAARLMQKALVDEYSVNFPQACKNGDIAADKCKIFGEQEDNVPSEPVTQLVPQAAPVGDNPAGQSGDEFLPDGTNLDALAYAVSRSETGYCTTGMALTKNNCHGIMIFPKSGRTGKTYADKADSFRDFKDIWRRLYGRYPDYALADKYTGGDDTADWLRIVNESYSEYDSAKHKFW